MVPGEPEKETKAYRLANGVKLPVDTWNEIQALCKGLDIPTDGMLI
jgi:LDH2 family malate/lactate/ureidoglycolate dehydrogenase